MRTSRTGDCRAGTHHRVPSERPLVVFASLAARPALVAAPARRMTGAMAFNAADVVVPVYNAPADVRACVASVLAHLRPDVRLVLIDDASPDPDIAAYFAELEPLRHPQLVLLRNEVNLGFT